VATTAPTTLPEGSTWYLVTNLPAANAEHRESTHPTADVADIVRLYGLRIWVEQSYKQVKQSLGWAQYQVRGDRAIRRHWQLVCCAFSFCWWAAGQETAVMPQEEPAHETVQTDSVPPATEPIAGRGGNGRAVSADACAGVVARSGSGGARLAGTMDTAAALVAGVERHAPTASGAATA
jgi:hypothetical protein